MCGLCRVRRARLTRHNPHMTMTQAPVTETGSDDARAAARMTWAHSVSSGTVEALHRASADAGFRSYWRGAPAGIVMDSDRKSTHLHSSHQCATRMTTSALTKIPQNAQNT